MNALLLSAGLGTRFQPTTNKLAKPCIPFLNVPLMGYTLFYLEKCNLRNLVLNTHHLPKNVESVAECLTYQQNYKVHFSHEPKILGSGGGIKQAEKYLRDSAADADDYFIVANADEVILFNHAEGFQPLIDFHKKNNALVTMLTTEHPDAGTKLGGLWADENNIITKLGGLSDAPHARHFTGVYVFSTRVFSLMPARGEFHIFKDCLHKAMAANEKVLSFHDKNLIWLDNSSEKDYIASTRMALKTLNGNSLAAKNLSDILHRFHQKFEKVSNRQWLCAGAQFEGVLNKDSYLFMGPDSKLKMSTEVKDFAVVGANSTFGPGYLESVAIAPNIKINELVSLRSQLVV